MIFGPIKQKKTPPTGARGVNEKKKQTKSWVSEIGFEPT